MFTRQMNAQRAEFERDDNGDLVVNMAFSSDKPAERWFGLETLVHDRKSIRLERLKDGAPVLFNHDWDRLLGTHEASSLKIGKDGVLRGKVRISSATEQGREAIALIESGVLMKSSIGYVVHRMVEVDEDEDGRAVEVDIDVKKFERALEAVPNLTRDMRTKDATLFGNYLADMHNRSRRKKGPPEYRVTDWEPLENSLVTIPLDNSVGIGRGFDGAAGAAADDEPAAIASNARGQNMGTKNTAADDAATLSNKDNDKIDARVEPSIDVVEAEKKRIRGIRNIGKANSIDERYVEDWIRTGKSIDEISDDLLKILETRQANAKPLTHIGMENRETERYSIGRAILACATGNWKNAELEAEASQAVAQKLGKSPDERTFFVPFEQMERRHPVPPAMRRFMQQMGMMQRDLSAGTDSAGGYLVSTENMSFIELLYARSVMLRMGARRLPGLVSNVTIPRLGTGGTAYWLTNEATQITESSQVFEQVSISPKNVGGYTEISRQLMMQSRPAAEGIVSDDLARAVALAVDLAGLEGDGTGGAPTGIANTGGIGSVTGTSLGYAGVLEFQEDVAGAEVIPMAGGYATTAAVASLMMQRVKFTSTASPLWEGNIWNGNMVGFPAMSSSQLTAASMIFGDWSEAILGEWGVLEIEVNPFANFQAAITGIRAIYSVDWAIRHAGAFSRATTIT